MPKYAREAASGRFDGGRFDGGRSDDGRLA